MTTTHKCAELLSNAAHMNGKSGSIYQKTGANSHKLLLFQAKRCPYCEYEKEKPKKKEEKVTNNIDDAFESFEEWNKL